MAWTGLVLTVEGRNALNNAQLAGRIQFKSIVVGDGAAPVNFRTLKNLVHQLYEITDIKVDVTENGCTITADFPKVEYDYYFREIGIIVTTDEGDKLYVYDNCGEDAQYMVSSTGVETTKKRIRLALAISDVEDITVDAAEILYVAYDDYESTVKILKQGLQEESERAKSKEENLNERLLEESKRAKKEEQDLTEKLEKETNRAKIAEEGLTEKLQEESSRAQRAEENLTNSLQEEVSRAQRAEETNKNNLANHVADKTNPHKVTKVQVGLGNVDNTADVNKPVSTAQQNALDSAYRQATGYTDQKIADLIGGAPETLDTLKEVADAIQTNKDVSAALDAAIGKKANQTELDTHTGNNTIHITSQERTNWNDANTKKHTHSNKGVLDKITQALLDSWNAACSHISDAVKHITAAERTLWNTVSNKVDKVAGKGLSSNDYTTTEKNKLAGIAEKANNYTHPTTAGNKHIPSGGSSGKILRWSADGVAAWGDDNNTTYSAGNQMELSGTAFKLKGVCTTVTDWNNATTNGWYMASSAANAPVSGWCYGIAVVHNSNYLRQIVWHFAADANVSGANCDRFERVKHNGSWGSWINTSVRKAVPSNAVFTDTTYTAATQSANGLMSAADKKKLDGIAISANNYSLPLSTASVRGGVKIGYSQNGKNYPVQLNNEQMYVNVPWTDTNTTYSAATQSANGLMSAADKKKLDNIAEAANKTVIDSTLSSSSTNPVQNKVVKSALDGKAASDHAHNNIRQILCCKSGTTIEITYPAYKYVTGSSVSTYALDNVIIYMQYAPYPYGVYDMFLNHLYGSEAANRYVNLAGSTSINNDGTVTRTLSRAGGFSDIIYVQVEYTAGITTVTLT